MKQSEIDAILRRIEIETKITNTLMDVLIKKISLSSQPPLPWVESTKQSEAVQLREKNPEVYDYVCEILKLFFT